MLTIGNEQLQHIAEFRKEAELWVATNVLPFLPATKITHVLAGSEVLTSSPGDAYSLVPAMLNLHAGLVAARLDDGRVVRVSTTLSGLELSDPSSSTAVMGHLLRFMRETRSPFFLKARPSEAIDAAMRALGFSGIPVIAAEAEEELGGGAAPLVYHSYMYGRRLPTPGGAGARRSLATGTFCVALQNADPSALQAGLSWACGQSTVDCSPIQPGGACYKQDDLAALASYAFNDYYQKSASTGATCSFNGIATTTATDPSKHLTRSINSDFVSS